MERGMDKLTKEEKIREDYLRKSQWKIKYGLTPTEYNRIYSKQRGLCAICGAHAVELNCFLCVDHDHKTGKIRGLLCKNCNTGLGMFVESRGNLIKAIQYLAKHGKKGEKNG